MWKDFKRTLEERVRRFKAKPDRFVVLRCLQKTLSENFGSVGLENTEIEINKDRISEIKVKCKNSVWKNELRLRKNFLINQVNGKLKTKTIKEIIIF